MSTDTKRQTLHDSIRDYEGGGFPVTRVVDSTCSCGGEVFVLGYDDDEGVAVRLCSACDREFSLLDSDDVLADATEDMELDAAVCTCDGTDFLVSVGFAEDASGEIRWVSIGLSCVDCALAGVYTDWAIDYTPTAQLIQNV